MNVLRPLEGRRQTAVEFILDSGRALSEAEYERVQALHSRDVRPLAATQV